MQLAQANIARMLYPRDDPRMAGFFDQIDAINAHADASPGFVWRLQTAEGDATSIRVFDDDELIFNMSVWESVEALRDFTYRSAHALPFKNRQSWFEPSQRPMNVLWWVAVGHQPDAEEAEERFRILWKAGPSAEGFTFRSAAQYASVLYQGFVA